MSKERLLVKWASKSSSGRFKNDFESIVSDMSRAHDSKDRGKTWSYHETLELIKNWGDDEMQEQLSTTLRNYHVYGLIAKKMTAKGFRRTAEQCRCKIKGMKLMYRKCKDEDDVEKAQKMFTFYRLMDSIMSRRPISPLLAHIRPETSLGIRGETGLANRRETGFLNRREAAFDMPGTSQSVIENVMNERETWGGVRTKEEKIDETEFSCGFATPNHERENSNDMQLMLGDEECETIVDDGDSEPETTTMPLDVQIGNSEEEDEAVVISKMANADTKRELDSRDPSPIDDSSSRKRKRVSKTIRQQEHLADRILNKFMINEERLLHVFLEAEERMMSKVEQMEERRMKFEQELAEKQRRDDTLRFDRIVQLLSQTTSQQQQQAPPRVVYMQEVNPPTWTT